MQMRFQKSLAVSPLGFKKLAAGKFALGTSLTLLLSLMVACSSDEPVATSASPVKMEEGSGISISALSTKPWLVTGGDVLVEISLQANLDASELSVRLNDAEVRGEFIQVSSLRLQALLSNLPLGESILRVEIASSPNSETLSLWNYPISGPIISGPHEQPFYCQATEFELVNGEMLAAGQEQEIGQEIDVAADALCSVSTRVDYVNWSAQDDKFKPYRRLAVTDLFGEISPEQINDSSSDGTSDVASSDPATEAAVEYLYPLDIAEITNLQGESIPYIVRVETGTVNRAVYEIAMLHDPDEGDVDPWNPSSRWNGKLVYTHGGGCRGGWFQQGTRTGGVMRQGLFEQGYAVASSTLNVFGQNCNDLLASETHIMVKERFIEHYGVPIYTLATGASGGSYQSHQTADNYPGVFDGIIVSSSFPDVTTATIYTLADSRLLNYYFTEVNTEDFTTEQQRAIAGFGSWGSIPNLSRGAARLDPIYFPDTPDEEQGGEVSIEALQDRRYLPSNLNGIRATVYDHTINVYGSVDGGPIAQRPLDNVGVQYGLAALDDGVITPQQFIDLNRDIGGFDRDMNHVSLRHRADAGARKRAIESGRILFGGAGLATTPVIDYRSYTDDRENGDIHMIVHQFSTRQRMFNANGHAENHIMQVGGLWGFTEEQPDLAELFQQMDSWLMAIRNDQSDIALAAKVVINKPARLVDACWDNSGENRVRLEQQLTFAGDSRCNELYPAFPTPRHVAGAPLANDVVSCQLRPLNPADYAVSFSTEQYTELRGVFPQGVCDWSRGDVSEARHQGVWSSFGPSSVNKLY